MKRTILYILIGLLMPLAAVAQSSMTDDQVMRFVLKETTYAREARDAALRAIAPYTRNNAPDMLSKSGDED